jgi:hypothetical protein
LGNDLDFVSQRNTRSPFNFRKVLKDERSGSLESF